MKNTIKENAKTKNCLRFDLFLFCFLASTVFLATLNFLSHVNDEFIQKFELPKLFNPACSSNGSNLCGNVTSTCVRVRVCVDGMTFFDKNFITSENNRCIQM